MFVAHDRKNTRMEQDPVPVRATREKKKTYPGLPTYIHIYIKVAPLPAAALVTLYYRVLCNEKYSRPQKSMPSVRPRRRTSPSLRKLQSGSLVCQVLLQKNWTFFLCKSILGTCEDATPF